MTRRRSGGPRRRFQPPVVIPLKYSDHRHRRHMIANKTTLTRSLFITTAVIALLFLRIPCAATTVPTIHYLSDTERAACYLMALQTIALGFGTKPYAFDEQRKKLIDEAIDRLDVPGTGFDKAFKDDLLKELEHTEPATPYEDPFTMLAYEQRYES